MSSARFLERSFGYCTRFAIAIQNLGFLNAIRIFVWVRGGPQLRSFFSPLLGHRVFFRGSGDKGVISHFFYPGTRILDTPEYPVRVIVDAGANIGMETIRMRHFFPAARVLAVEPDRGNYSVLQKNAEQHNGLVETTCNGLWSSDMSLKVMPGTTNEAFSVRPAQPDEKADVEAITMNTILARVGGEIDIVKMDIEGTEFEVFRIDTDWVHHVKAFVFECPDSDKPGAAFQIFSALVGMPFDTFVSGENIVLIRRDTGWKVVTTPYLSF